MARFRGRVADLVMRWFRDCARLAPDAESLGRETISRLTATTAFIVRPEALEDWQQLVQSMCRIPSPERIRLSLESRCVQADMAPTIWTRCSISRRRSNPLRPAAKLRLDLVTRNAQPAGSDLKPTSVAQAPGIGLMRVILNEYSNLSWRAIDLPPEPSTADAELLWSEIISQRRRTRNRVAR